MPIINLKKYYYPIVKSDTFVEVSDEVAEGLLQLRRDEDRIISRIRYHKAYYSLDADNGIENSALNWEQPSPENILIQREDDAHYELTLQQVDEAMAILTPVEKQYIHARFIEKKKYREIAQAEGITDSKANYNVRAAVNKLRRYFEKHDWKLWED